MKIGTKLFAVMLTIFLLSLSATEAIARRRMLRNPITSQVEGFIGGGESWGDLRRDQLLFGPRGQWADYLKAEWEHKDLVVDAFFVNELTVRVVMKTEAKPRKAELEGLIKKSYAERVLPIAKETSLHYEVIPRDIIVHIVFKK